MQDCHGVYAGVRAHSSYSHVCSHTLLCVCVFSCTSHMIVWCLLYTACLQYIVVSADLCQKFICVDHCCSAVHGGVPVHSSNYWQHWILHGWVFFLFYTGPGSPAWHFPFSQYFMTVGHYHSLSLQTHSPEGPLLHYLCLYLVELHCRLCLQVCCSYKLTAWSLMHTTTSHNESLTI